MKAGRLPRATAHVQFATSVHRVLAAFVLVWCLLFSLLFAQTAEQILEKVHAAGSPSTN